MPGLFWEDGTVYGSQWILNFLLPSYRYMSSSYTYPDTHFVLGRATIVHLIYGASSAVNNGTKLHKISFCQPQEGSGNNGTSHDTCLF